MQEWVPNMGIQTPMQFFEGGLWHLVEPDGIILLTILLIVKGFYPGGASEAGRDGIS